MFSGYPQETSMLSVARRPVFIFMSNGITFESKGYRSMSQRQHRLYISLCMKVTAPCAFHIIEKQIKSHWQENDDLCPHRMTLPPSHKNAYHYLSDNTDIMIGRYSRAEAPCIVSSVEIHLESRWQEQSAFRYMVDDTCTKSQVYVPTPERQRKHYNMFACEGSIIRSPQYHGSPIEVSMVSVISILIYVR